MRRFDGLRAQWDDESREGFDLRTEVTGQAILRVSPLMKQEKYGIADTKARQELVESVIRTTRHIRIVRVRDRS